MALHSRPAAENASRAMVSSFEVAVMRCEGDVGEFELAHMNEELFRLAHYHCNKVILDLSGVEHVHYRGLRALALRARLLREAGGDLKLVGLSPYLVTIFCAAGVSEEFERYDSVDAAKAAFVNLPALAWARS